MSKQHWTDAIHILLVGPQGGIDKLASMTFGMRTSLIGRSYVVYQWLVILKVINPHYYAIKIPSFSEFDRAFSEAIDATRDGAEVVTENDALEKEMAIGSDVAMARHGPTEEASQMTGESTETPVEVAGDEETTAVDSGFAETESEEVEVQSAASPRASNAGNHAGGKDVSVRHSFVLRRDPPSTRNSSLQAFRAVAKSMGVNLDDQEPSPESQEADAGTSSQKQNGDNRSRRDSIPVNDIGTNDFAFCCAFPHIFMLGQAYGKAPG